MTFRRNIASVFRAESAEEDTSVKAGGKSTCSSETSVDFQRIIRRYIAEDNTLQKQIWWEDL
jgi:hypothetical protein